MCLLICWGCKTCSLHPVYWQHLGHMSRLGQSTLGCVLRRADTAASADYVEEQWRFYGFCDTFEQARYIAVQGLSAGLGEPFHRCYVVLLPTTPAFPAQLNMLAPAPKLHLRRTADVASSQGIARGVDCSHLHELALPYLEHAETLWTDCLWATRWLQAFWSATLRRQPGCGRAAPGTAQRTFCQSASCWCAHFLSCSGHQGFLTGYERWPALCMSLHKLKLSTAQRQQRVHLPELSRN